MTQPQWTAINKLDPVLTFATAQLKYTNYRPNLAALPADFDTRSRR